MDINDLRGLSTVFMMIAFIGICWWAFAPKRKQQFDDAANLPFVDEEQHQRAAIHSTQQNQRD
ncbi:MAG: cbb3-type cytochrome c oxidase subunit 3 [Cellvibrionaceae bacterium]|nr:cbb3-type cytochrome c oxidase subunit 3 [Cellvibrionaceae bacterium]